MINPIPGVAAARRPVPPACVLLAVLILAATASSARAESCVASQYGVGDGYDGRRTASGTLLDTRHALTAAHRTLPFGSRVTVTHLGNGRSVSVVVTDRGPFIRGRCIDLTRAAANAIGMGGIAKVTVER
jgi:peptidoglycan lytic transglycosylase